MEFSHQLFNHTFINAAVKMAILGRDFLKSNDLVENYRCRYLTQTGTCLIIKSVDENQANNTNVNNVSVHHKLASLFKEFPNISGYSKFAPTHGVEHHITTDHTRPVRSRARPLFGAKKKAAQKEFAV